MRTEDFDYPLPDELIAQAGQMKIWRRSNKR